MIEVEGEVSSLSIISQQNTSEKGANLSTNKTSTFDGEPTGLQLAGSSEKIRALRSKLFEMEKRQRMFERKMENCVGIIEIEVKQKEDQNKELA